MALTFGFEKGERVALIIIFGVLFLFMAFNYNNSLRKSRDVQRKADVRSILDMVGAFQETFGFLPISQNGKLVACNPQEGADGSYTFSDCDWGQSEEYLGKLPRDPNSSDGKDYYFVSNGKRYQVYASLESKGEAEYDTKIAARNLACGTFVCNFGLSSAQTPLDKSLEEYENELREKDNAKTPAKQ